MTEQLVITALGEDRPGIVDELSNALTAHDLNIEDSRMGVLGGACSRSDSVICPPSSGKVLQT